MKKVFFSTFFALSISASSFATDGKNDLRILNKVSEHFSNVSNIEVSEKENFTMVSFSQHGKKVQAFYDLKAELIGSSQAIDVTTLPTNAKRIFAKKYDAYTVTEAILFNGVDELAYYISAKKDGQTVVLKVSEGGMVNVFKKIKKGSSF